MRTLPFDQRQRYDVVAALRLVLRTPDAPRILDVGGYYEDLERRPALPIRDVVRGARATTIDRENGVSPSESERTSLAGYARADAAALPFLDSTFDIVACLDVLEHVHRSHRKRVVEELFRTSRQYVVLAMPVADDGADVREAYLDRFIRRLLDSEHRQLHEHREFGLPRHEEVVAMLPAATRSFGYGNLDRWYWMMLAKHYLLALPHNLNAFEDLDQAYAELDALADRRPPFYRRFYLAPARAEASLAPLDEVARRYAPAGPEPDPSHDLLPWIFERLAATDAGRLAAESGPWKASLAEVTQVLRSVEQSRVYRLYRLFRRETGERPSAP